MGLMVRGSECLGGANRMRMLWWPRREEVERTRVGCRTIYVK
jgi:hypothetical protein